MVSIQPLNPGSGSNTATQNVKILTPNGDSPMNDTADAIKALIVDGSGAAATFGDTTALQKGGSGQTLFCYTGLKNSADNTIHTVTGGKTFYLSKILWTADVNGTIDVYIKDNATAVIQMKLTCTVGHCINFDFAVPIAFTHSVHLLAASGNVYPTFIGWEQ